MFYGGCVRSCGVENCCQSRHIKIPLHMVEIRLNMKINKLVSWKIHSNEFHSFTIYRTYQHFSLIARIFVELEIMKKFSNHKKQSKCCYVGLIYIYSYSVIILEIAFMHYTASAISLLLVLTGPPKQSWVWSSDGCCHTVWIAKRNPIGIKCLSVTKACWFEYSGADRLSPNHQVTCRWACATILTHDQTNLSPVCPHFYPPCHRAAHPVPKLRRAPCRLRQRWMTQWGG